MFRSSLPLSSVRRITRCLLSTQLQSEGTSLQKALLRSVKPNNDTLSTKYFPDVKVEPIPIYQTEPEKKSDTLIPTPIPMSSTKHSLQAAPVFHEIPIPKIIPVTQQQFVQGHLHEFAPRIIVRT